MKISRLPPLLPLIASCVLAVSSWSPAKTASNSHRPQESNGSPAHSMVVYVSDFDLEVLNGRAPRRTPSRNSPSATSGSASTIPSATQKNTPPGSSPKKPAPAPTADSQPDETPAEQADKLVNIMAVNPLTPRMLLYVGVNNLSRPQQPLYELANPPSNDAKHGPVITVTSYSPAVRFEMDRNAADDDFKKIASQIVADLNALLIANPMMATH